MCYSSSVKPDSNTFRRTACILHTISTLSTEQAEGILLLISKAPDHISCHATVHNHFAATYSSILFLGVSFDSHFMYIASTLLLSFVATRKLMQMRH
ncbi:hypothetical protein Y032_0017g3445 [Ancylostoma ceylanicum]|uniref:Uncharacterized protein n=1 Tax=Ancylostoma ceylanicum TaxID=53326 RepID=A0A016V4M1_9BILA|nr:hypothetical protein Y032_0017g3445 [Ancylostoma ceylanicum]